MYWATVVGINLNGTGPFVGPLLAQFLRGGSEIGADTLTRFYSLHMLVLPGALFALIGTPPLAVIRLGVTPQPWARDPSEPEPEPVPSGRPGLVRPGARGTGPMSSVDRLNRYSKRPLSRRHRTNAQSFDRYKDRTKHEGRRSSRTRCSTTRPRAPSWSASSSRWRASGTSRRAEPRGLRRHGRLPASARRYTELPTLHGFIPRPDWYFYFLYPLRIFKWPESVILGTVGIPTILLMLLIAILFLDVRRERSLFRRPVAVTAAILVVLSMGVLTYKGATAEEALGGSEEPRQRVGGGEQPARGSAAGGDLLPGGRLPELPHLPRRGSSNLGAPDLTDVGDERSAASRGLSSSSTTRRP